MSKKPTEAAQHAFNYGVIAAYQAVRIYDDKKLDQSVGDHSLAVAVHRIAKGLNEMAIGLRATYILLEQVERDVAALKARQGG